MRISIRAAGAVTAALLATACTSGGAADGPAATPGKVDLTGRISLVAYTSCDEMLAGLRAATEKSVGPWGFNGPMLLEAADAKATAATGTGASASYSTTNVHEAGVDEPDLVKTDGKRVIVVTQGVLRVVDAETRKITGELRLVPKDQSWVPADLLVSGDRALVLMTQGGALPFGAVAKMRPGPIGPKYVLVDLAGEKPAELGSLSIAGSHVDARMVGSTVRIVTRSVPDITFPESKPDAKDKERIAANVQAVRKAPIESWLPKFEIESGGATTPGAVKCENVSHPADFSGTSMLTVHTLDLNAAFGAVEPISVAADGDTVYSTKDSLYVTSNPSWFFVMPVDVAPADTASGSVAPSPDPEMPTLIPDAPKVEPSHPDADQPITATPEAVPSPSAVESAVPEPSRPPERTEIHRFDITSPGSPRYVGSGAVPGRLLNQYSLSEHNGHLRVATTSDAQVFGATEGTSESGVYVLNADTLAQVGSVTGLGKGERIYSVRFIGDLGYVVTFRQVDPLYALDLRDPAAPRITGELKITGYSAYLHPGGPGRLIGVGQEATTEGRTVGTQVSLFDVNDPANPRILSRYLQEMSGTEAEWDPHAFLYWPEDGLAMIPLMSWGDNWADGSKALVLKITDTTMTKAGEITHPKVSQQNEFAPVNPGIRRCLIIGDTIWTVSDLGLKASDSTTLTDRAWIPFV
ncbi:beta-propeller domain-containing protein [Acrocarpospora catenulata]|uniref:beta-propeller domain-containing protein n=1 Tax=Acrocarpospora catenulata TaxID=2836182 RepID=UPI001BDADED8|nr:beta-propeller domain-containing protein [Acrocarpospora catenulata]